MLEFRAPSSTTNQNNTRNPRSHTAQTDIDSTTPTDNQRNTSSPCTPLLSSHFLSSLAEWTATPARTEQTHPFSQTRSSIQYAAEETAKQHDRSHHPRNEGNPAIPCGSTNWSTSARLLFALPVVRVHYSPKQCRFLPPSHRFERTSNRESRNTRTPRPWLFVSRHAPCEALPVV